MKCYYIIFNNLKYIEREVITPLDIAYSKWVHLHDNGLELLGNSIVEIKLKPYTVLNKFKLIPAICAAKLARAVRKITGKKCTSLENKLMKFYYQEEVKVRGYVE